MSQTSADPLQASTFAALAADGRRVCTAATMMQMPLLPAACLFAILASCSRSDTMTPPCPADGRFVAVYIEDDPTEKTERIEGELVRWSDGWASLRKGNLTIHVPVAQIRVVHASSK